MLSFILSLFTSSSIGAIIGLIGSWLTKKNELANINAKYQYELELARIRSQEAKLELEHELKIADKHIERSETEATIQKDIVEVEAFRDSLRLQESKTGNIFVDAVRGLMRPLITIYLLIIATYITLKIGGFVSEMEYSLSQNDMVNLYKEIILQLLFLVTTVVTWWFGSRPSSSRKAR